MRHSPFATLLLFSLLAVAVTTRADSADAVAETVGRAAALHREALALQHGWSVTEPLLEQAREALQAGDVQRARELADRALLTAEQSVKQARREADRWQRRVLRE